MVTLIGMGGCPSTLTKEALDALQGASLITGAERLLGLLPPCSGRKAAEVRPERLLSLIQKEVGTEDADICAVFSGDTGFYSGASALSALLAREGIPCRILPGISSVQLLAARLCLSWKDWRLCSAHGRKIDPVTEVLSGQDVFFLTGGEMTPDRLCAALAKEGLGHLTAIVGEDLSMPGERIRRGTAASFSKEHFSSLSVLLILQTVEENRKSDGFDKAVPHTVPSGRGRLLIAAAESGSGKTVLTSSLLTLLKRRGISCEAFKCGPDYIDPMFHEKVLGTPCRNLDSFLQGKEGVRKSLGRQKASFALIEGAMGYYDGAFGTIRGSAFDISSITRTPVVLLVRPGKSSVTLAAQIKGIVTFRRPSFIKGIILTMCRESLYEYLKPVIEKETGIPVLGYFPPLEEAKLESRHLGLLKAGEIAGLTKRFDAAADTLEKTVDIDALLSIAGEAGPVPEAATDGASTHAAATSTQAAASTAAAASAAAPSPVPAGRGPVIAVARDEAFCFYYEDSLEALREAGAELVSFSPLHDEDLPPCDGLYLGGGYPELYAGQLEDNRTMRERIAEAVASGLPTVAECGGFLYLQKTLEDTDGIKHEMAGVFPGSGIRTDRLQHFGYAEIVPETDSLLFRKGERIPAHEFHYWETTESGNDLCMERPDRESRRCGFATPTLYAAFPHLPLGGRIPLAERFAAAAERRAHHGT